MKEVNRNEQPVVGTAKIRHLPADTVPGAVELLERVRLGQALGFCQSWLTRLLHQKDDVLYTTNPIYWRFASQRRSVGYAPKTGVIHRQSEGKDFLS